MKLKFYYGSFHCFVCMLIDFVGLEIYFGLRGTKLQEKGESYIMSS